MKVILRVAFALCFLWIFHPLQSFASGSAWKYDFPSSPPYSEFIELPESGLTTPFCAEWNPDFPYRGGQCCGKVPRRGTNSGGFCPAARAKGSFCDETTDDQTLYMEQMGVGKSADILQLIDRDQTRRLPQAFCSPNNGFLAWGRPVIPSLQNRVLLKSPARCTYFGTDAMVGMLEWVGRRVKERYSDSEHSGVRLVLGDISAPRGGCLKGRAGRRGHSSHMSGQDVDVGFINVHERQPSSPVFNKQFDPEANWWLVKQIFKNPYACVKVIFLDRAHIRKLIKVAAGDPDWAQIGTRIHHVRNHKNHMHIRIGDIPGAPGCVYPNGAGEQEEEEEEG